jgi:hypothetical protein
VNELLGETDFPIPLIEFNDSFIQGTSIICPTIHLTTGERTEKERIINLDVYTLTVSFSIPETPEAERYSYAYTQAAAVALGKDATLGGIVDRVMLTKKEYRFPKHPGSGEEFEAVLSLRVIIEGIGL